MRPNLFSRCGPRAATGRQPFRRTFLPLLELLESRLVLMGLTGPPPTISSLGPNIAVEGGPTFTLTVNGSNFQHGAVVDWNGMDLPTTFVSSSKLTATVSASLLKEETGPEHGGPIAITVVEFNVPSNVVPFTIAEAPIVAHGGFSFTGPILNNVTLATFTDTGGPELPFPIDYVASVNWGDGVTDVGTITGPDASGVFTVTGSHAYANLNPTTITVTIIHESAPPVTVTDFVNGGGPATLVGGFTFSGKELQPINNVKLATFTNPNNPGETASNFSATIDWGDGMTSTGTITGPDTNGQFMVTGSHTYPEDGEAENDLVDHFTVTVTVLHNGTNPATVTDTANIAEEDEVFAATGGFNISGVEGQPTGNVTVATFKGDGSDPASSFTAAINWGDGTTSNGTITGPNASGVFTVTGSHTYKEEGAANHGGPFKITVTIAQAGAPGTAVTVTDTTTIADASLSATGGFAFTGPTLSNVVLATFTDTGGPESLSDYAANIAWGDGSSSAGTITGPNGSGVFTVTGSHTYSGSGPFTITVTITHETAPPVTVTDTVNVAQPTTISASGGFTVFSVEGPSQTPTLINNATVATFTSSNPNAKASDFTATIQWGDGSFSGVNDVTSGTITGPDANGVFTVKGSYTYVEESEDAPGSHFVITVTISPSTGASAVALSQAIVFDAAINATGGFNITSTAGQPTGNVTLATFVDTGGQIEIGTNIYVATIDWGDGSPQDTQGFTGSEPLVVTGNHTYATAGTFTITVTISHEFATPVTVTDTATISPVVSPPGGGGRAEPRQGAPAPVDVQLAAPDLLFGMSGFQQQVGPSAGAGASAAEPRGQGPVLLAHPSTPVPAAQSSRDNDAVWQTLAERQDDRILNPNEWAAYELALALDSNVPGRTRWWSSPA